MAVDSSGKEVVEFVAATKSNLETNACVIRPIAELMAKNDLLLPAIDRLILAIEEYYLMAKRTISHENAYNEAWAVRRLIGKLKRYVYRPVPPEDCV